MNEPHKMNNAHRKEALDEIMWPKVRACLLMIWLSAGVGGIGLFTDSAGLMFAAVFLFVSFTVRLLWLGGVAAKVKKSWPR